jgi:hypothetical protein
MDNADVQDADPAAVQAASLVASQVNSGESFTALWKNRGTLLDEPINKLVVAIYKNFELVSKINNAFRDANDSDVNSAINELKDEMAKIPKSGGKKRRKSKKRNNYKKRRTTKYR